MNDLNEVQVKPSLKKRLAELREEEQANGRRRDDSFSSQGYAESGTERDLENAGRAEGFDRGDQDGTGRAEEGSRFSPGTGEGVRSAFREDEYPVASAGQSDPGSLETVDIPLVPLPAPRETPEQRAERAKELHRQRQQRYKDRQRAAQADEIPATMLEGERETSASRPVQMGHVTPLAGPAGDGHHFSLKLPFLEKRSGDGKPEKVKLFSNKEAEEKLEKFTDIYRRGSGLLDDILEIVTKDHEPVAIWQLDQEDAATMAAMHLERAKFDEGAARSARKLEEIHDRFFFWWLVGPRMKASYSYVKEHGGISFR